MDSASEAIALPEVRHLPPCRQYTANTKAANFHHLGSRIQSVPYYQLPYEFKYNTSTGTCQYNARYFGALTKTLLTFYKEWRRTMKHSGFSAAEILLPNFEQIEGSRWSVVACDQFTSERGYWEKAEALVPEIRKINRQWADFMTEGLSEEEQQLLERVLESIRDRIRQEQEG